MKVKALPSEKCPMENNHREYITDDIKGVKVPDTIYYRRLVDEGSLVKVAEDDQHPKHPADKGGKP